MKKMNLVDKVIKEPEGGAHRNKEKTFELVKSNIISSYTDLKELSSEKLVSTRMEKYSNMGVYSS
jgi:acetyl-CoA carboxylase carboxyl transferase subunit alpha